MSRLDLVLNCEVKCGVSLGRIRSIFRVTVSNLDYQILLIRSSHLPGTRNCAQNNVSFLESDKRRQILRPKMEHCLQNQINLSLSKYSLVGEGVTRLGGGGRSSSKRTEESDKGSRSGSKK